MFFHFHDDETPIDIRVIGLKQNPSHYDLNEFQIRHIAEIINVYVFDFNRHVHCAELTPSYELHKLYTTVTLVDDEELTDSQRDSIRDPIEQATDDNDVIYVHTRSIDRVIEEHTRLDRLITSIDAYRKDFDNDGDPNLLDQTKHYLQGCMRRLSYVKTLGITGIDGPTLGVDPVDYETKELFAEAAINAALEYYQGNCPI